MHSNPNPEEKHVPMQHQADYNPPLEFNDTVYRFKGGTFKSINMPLMCEGPGPEIISFDQSTKVISFSNAGIGEIDKLMQELQEDKSVSGPFILLNEPAAPIWFALHPETKQEEA